MESGSWIAVWLRSRQHLAGDEEEVGGALGHADFSLWNTSENRERLEKQMAETVRIPLDEMPDQLRSILEQALRDKQTIVIDVDEDGFLTLKSGGSEEELELPPGKTEEDYRAFLDSFGSWEDVDTGQLLRDIRESRDKSRSASIFDLPHRL